MIDDSTKKMFEHILLPVNYWESKLSLVQEESHKDIVEDWYYNILEKIENCTGLGIWHVGEF